jgi:hypothetical protein
MSQDHVRIYIAGPMTGFVDHNYPAFDFAESVLRQSGYKSIANPTAIGKQYGFTQSYSFYMRRSLEMMLDCNAILRLPGWSNSDGACLESRVADFLGFRTIEPLQELFCMPKLSETPLAHQGTTHGNAVPTNQESPSHGTTEPERQRTADELAKDFTDRGFVIVNLTPDTISTVHETFSQIFRD